MTSGFTVGLRAPHVQWLTYPSLYSQHKDCYKGVIFDGLESLFASSLESSLLCVLKAVKNRHHIFIVNLHQDYASCKAREEAERKREEAERQEEGEISPSLSIFSLEPSTLSLCIWVCSRACKKC